MAACYRGPLRLLALAAIVALAAVACSGDATPAGPTAAPDPTPASTLTRAPTPAAAPIPTATPAPTLTAVTAPTPAPIATSEPTATPSPPSAQEVLDAVALAMSGVTTVHVEKDLTAKAALGGTSADFKMGVVGDLVVPDRSQSTMSVATAGFTFEFETITIGNDTYIKSPLTGEWETNTEPMLPIGAESFAMGAFDTDFPPGMAAKFTLTGVVELDGERVYHLSGTLTGADLAELMDDQDASPAEADVEADVQYWVGVDDYLVRKIEISFEDSGAEPLTNAADLNQLTYVAILSDYNSPVTIEKPDVAAGGGPLVFDDHGDSIGTATLIAVGESVEGEMDNDIDIDVFRFPAEEGQAYRIHVALGTLEDPLVSLYNSAGDEESWEEFRDEDGSTILWEPLWFDEYHVVVEAFGGTGTYTVTVAIE